MLEAVGTEICIPQKCKTHTVRGGDSCDKLAEAHGLTVAQLLEYNPEIDDLALRCEDLITLFGKTICLSPLGVVDMTTSTGRGSPLPAHTDVTQAWPKWTDSDLGGQGEQRPL